ncbi:MAG: 2-C-methyl-D-erythritol 2,4-cyclodiphosphate synthase [Holosporales bacterium]|jgi:2-C-methyl-D-erythritol 4-phosphate cytidylyltransferase/2-C-methyl-D-erythritol 2,4-cyclodiphosphate synthase|nr:2-C-methyl-D-erythritol 2,4-cyclodiphosphate synthase [Holosporales bacterium]
MSSTSKSQNSRRGRGNIFAIVAAAGIGSRYGGRLPKQFVSIGGKSPLRRSVELLVSIEDIDGVVCVIPGGFEWAYESVCGDIESLRLLTPVVGGASRGASIKLALDAIKEHSPEYVLVHDAVRSYCPLNVVVSVIDALRHGKSAVVPAIRPVDSLMLRGGSIDRNEVHIVQTPQGFEYDMLFSLYEKYETCEFSDDASLCCRDGIHVHIVDGSVANRKVTYKSDVMRGAMQRVGFGYDAHKFSVDKSRKLRLMGIEILDHPGLCGVSDADVGIHSVVDAILGALGHGSIGEHFPADDPSWRDADSRIFLEHCRKYLDSSNADVIRIDTTIVCESPNIAIYASAMQAEIARYLLIDSTSVNVKGKTTEGMGFEGRREGISAYSVATISSWESPD